MNFKLALRLILEKIQKTNLKKGPDLLNISTNSQKIQHLSHKKVLRILDEFRQRSQIKILKKRKNHMPLVPHYSTVLGEISMILFLKTSFHFEKSSP